MLQAALEKLDGQLKEAKAVSKHCNVMAEPVAQALKDFCRQEPEFAQAVVQGGSFAGCMKAVAKNCGSALSDLEAYRRAVQFYFPGAEIQVRMTISLCGAASKAPEPVGGGLLLDLTRFL